MKKTMTTVLLLVLVAALIAGCGGQAPAATTAAATTAAATAAAAGEPDPLHIWIPSDSLISSYEDNKYTRMMEEKTNTKLTFTIAPSEEALDKLNLLFASGGELPDAFLSIPSFTRATMVKYASQGFFIPLNDLLKDAPNYQMMITQYPHIEPLVTAPDGNIYCIPNYSMAEPNKFSQRFWINTDFLDALDMKREDIVTLDDYYDYLVGVRDNDVNGNGDSNDEIPLTGSKDGWSPQIDGFFITSFILNDMDTYCEVVNGGTIQFNADKPEWKNALEWLNKLAVEKLLDPNAYTQTNDQLRELCESGDVAKVASVTSGGTHMFCNNNGTRKHGYWFLEPLEGPTGLRQAKYTQYDGVGISTFLVSCDNKTPEVAVRFADYQLTAEATAWNRYGEPGVDWIVPPAGTKAVDGNPAQYEEILKWEAIQNSHWRGKGTGWGRFGSYARADDGDPFELESILWQSYVSYLPYANMNILPPMMYEPDDADELTQLKKLLTDHVKQNIAAFIYGQRPLSEFDAYVQELNDFGLQTYIDIQQKAYDRQWK